MAAQLESKSVKYLFVCLFKDWKTTKISLSVVIFIIDVSCSLRYLKLELGIGY